MTDYYKQHKSFQKHLEKDKIKSSRMLGLVGSFLYSIFILVDFFSLQANLVDVLLVRGGVVAILISGFIYSYHHSFIKNYDVTLSILYLSSAIGIDAMIYLALPGDHASRVYFVGLILIIMTAFSWSYFDIRISSFVTSVIISLYVYIEVLKGSATAALSVNVFFLLSAAVIGFISQLIRDRYVQENFFLQQSLSEALDEKTEEAKDNAYLANHDELTSLPNRRYATELLEKSLVLAKEQSKILVIMFVDLNGFKQINDIYGHAVGDEVLKIVARRIELAVRKSDCLSRLGGDEFLIGLLMEQDNVSEIENMAEKFSVIISDPMKIDGIKLQVGASVGIAAYPYHGNKVSVLMEIADQRMYQAKRGKNETGSFIDKNDDSAVVMFPGKTKY